MSGWKQSERLSQFFPFDKLTRNSGFRGGDTFPSPPPLKGLKLFLNMLKHVRVKKTSGNPMPPLLHRKGTWQQMPVILFIDAKSSQEPPATSKRRGQVPRDGAQYTRWWEEVEHAMPMTCLTLVHICSCWSNATFFQVHYKPNSNHSGPGHSPSPLVSFLCTIF